MEQQTPIYTACTMGQRRDPPDEVVARELPEFLHILEEIKTKVPAVTQHVLSLSEHVQRSECNAENGISLLEVKVHLMLSSLINLTQLMLLKTDGHSINHSPPVHRLVEIRTVLEKIRPLDQKLHYQIDKLIRIATTGLAGPADDPLRFRANPAHMVSKLGVEEEEEEEEEGEEEEGEETAKPKLYVPPRVAAMPYEEEEGKKWQERQKRKVLRSTLVQDLKNEYLDHPEEVHDVGAGMRRQKDIDEEKEREKYEEAHFMRLPSKRKRGTSGQGMREALDELVELGDLPAAPNRGAAPARKKGRSSAGGAARRHKGKGKKRSRVRGRRR